MWRIRCYSVALAMLVLLAAGRGDAQEEQKVDTMPVPTMKAKVVYPEEALSKGVEGTVWVKAYIDEAGAVRKAEILKTDAAVFKASALEAAGKWKFSPALKDGKPVAVWVTLPFRYKLAEGGAKKKE
jgi:protein TonB